MESLLLDKIDQPSDLKKLNTQQVEKLCQLANIHRAAYKNLPVTEVKLPGEGGTKKRCKPRKKACSGAFWRPREDLNLRPHA